MSMSYCCTMRRAIIIVLFLACCVHGDVIGVITMTRHGDRTANYGKIKIPEDLAFI